MEIDWWTLVLQLTNTLVLIWLLARFFFRPIASIINQRQIEAELILSDAESIRTDTENERATLLKAQASLENNRQAIMTAQQREATEVRDQILNEARIEAELLCETTRSELRKFHDNARTEIENHATELALDLARKLSTRFPTSCLVSGFIEDLGVQLKALPESMRRDMGRDKQSVHLLAARKLTETELEDVEQMLNSSLGHKTQFDVEVDPAVIAGLELIDTHCTVLNSLRTDLLKIRRELLDVQSRSIVA